MKIGYLINTHPLYFKPLNALLKSMVAGGVHVADILVVSGGNQLGGIPTIESWSTFPTGCNLIEVEHNSFDYTALIEAVMLPHEPFFKEHTHLFLLQDTMEFGPRTHELVQTADPLKWATAAFGGQCNLCLYRYDYLLAMKDFILRQRNLTKEKSIAVEGALWKMLTQNLSHRDEASYANGAYQYFDGVFKPYSDVERIKEYYAGVDITKWKANYGQNMQAMIVKP